MHDFEGSWFDGVCRTCCSAIMEKPGDEKDYKNMCMNNLCEHHYWHEVYDTEKADYYIHK